jgi:hypothetical protein
MKKLLGEVTKVNKLFQSENADVTILTSDLLQLYCSFMQMIVIRAVMEKMRKHQLVSFPFRDHLRPFASVHLGYEFEQPGLLHRGKDASCIHFDLGRKEFPRAHMNLFNSAASVVTVTVKSET